METNSTDRKDSTWLENNPRKTSLILISILIVLLELVTRLFFPPHLVERKHIVPNELYFKNYLSDIKFVTYPSKHDNFNPVTNTINSIGIRGPELGRKTLYRVFSIGDSFIQADEVAFEDTFGERLNSSNLNMEFVSHGRPSWSPTPEFSSVYHNADTVDYDEVNLFLCINDFFRKGAYENVDEHYRSYANYSENGIPISYDIDAFRNQSFAAAAKEHFYLLRLAAYAKGKVTGAFPERNNVINPVTVSGEIQMLSRYSETWEPELRENVLATLAVVNRMSQFLERENIEFNVLFVPLGLAWEDEFASGKKALSNDWEPSVVFSQEGIETFTRQYLERRIINYIDLPGRFNLYKKANKNVSLFYDMDGHWTKDGHLLVYEILRSHYGSGNDEIGRDQ